MKGRISVKQASRRMRQRLLDQWSVMTFHRILKAKVGDYGVAIESGDDNLKGLIASERLMVCGAPSRQEVAWLNQLRNS